MKPIFETELGKLYQGDCLEVLKELPDNSVDLILTDPPYNISQNKKIDRTKINSRNLKRTGKTKDLNFNFGEWDFFSDNVDYYKFIESVSKLLYISAKDNCSIYMWLPKSEVSFIEFILKQIGWHIRTTLVWCKTNPTPQIFKVGYMSSTEFCTFGTKHKGAKHYWNTTRGQRHSYWITSICQGKERTPHPTQKKLEIIRDMIINSSKEGDLILDPFLGSGTTAIACEELNRRWVGIELSKEYCDIAIDRIKKVASQQKLF